MLQLFDSVELREAVILAEGETVPAGTRGAVVELFQDGQMILVELFGDLVKIDKDSNLVAASDDDPRAFAETIGLVTLSPRQVRRIATARQTVGSRAYLLSIIEELPEQSVLEIADFAEFLRQKQRQHELA